MATDTNFIAIFDEEGSGSISFEIKGLNGESVTPNTFLWTLSDTSGNIINSREDVSETPAAKNWVDLQGDDLAVSNDSDTIRVVTVKGTMDTMRGNTNIEDAPYTIEKRFDILTRVNI